MAETMGRREHFSIDEEDIQQTSGLQASNMVTMHDHAGKLILLNILQGGAPVR